MAKRIRTQSANDETALSSMPELLAPAGGPASWAAAMEAGADAIYAGLDRFSARSYAENFTLPELKGLIEESHRQDVKIYLAFNSAVKEQELPLAFRTMMMVCELGPPDGLIIQDLGLAYLAKRHLPTIPLHASTLTAVHSLDGLKSLRNLGFTRAVLPRELTVREIADIAHRSPIGVEIFIHGSLCFSFSGLCLMSSFLGGRSALRGGCTQPCRRAYQNAGRQATFFSPSDFSLAPFILDLKKLPISSFKIEGRMKGPDYVGQVVAAYRALIDSNDNDFPEALERAREMLARVPSRPVTERGFINGEPMAESLWNRQAVSGIKLGSIEPAANNLSQVRLLNPLHLGDRVRLVAGYGEEGEPKKIKKILSVDLTPITEAEAGQIVNLDLTSLSTQNSQNSSGSQSSPVSQNSQSSQGSPVWPNSQSSQGSQGSHNSQSSHDSKGSPNSQSSHGSPPLTGQLYLVGSSALEKNYLASEPVKRLKAAAKEVTVNLDAFALPPGLSQKESTTAMVARSHPLWFWLDGTKDLEDLIKFKPTKIVLPLNAETIKELSRQKKRLRHFSDFVWSLPPLLLGRSQEKIRKDAAKMIENGARDFMIANLGQIAIFENLAAGLKIWGDYRLGVLNHLSAKALTDLGLTGVTLSIESDQETISRLAQAGFTGGVLIFLYGRPPLFTARYRPPALKRGPVVSPRGEKFWSAEEGDAFILQSEHRVFCGGLLKVPKPRGFVGLLVDLRREPNPVEATRRLKKAIDQGRGSPGLAFNFRRGLQ